GCISAIYRASMYMLTAPHAATVWIQSGGAMRRPLPRPGRDRCPGAALQPGGDRDARAGRGRHRLVAAARPARAPVRARPDARPALVPALPGLLRARPAADRR